MTSDLVIHAENLGKRYRLGEFDPHKTLRESIRQWTTTPVRKFLGTGNRSAQPDAGKGQADETIWALRDASFQVRQGEVLGIIGRNGAGKSTLLKILTRITKPTTGRARIRGRVGSLLEVGTGFHPELTGRENVFLNGIILGMTRAEIKRKFDQIVDFSGVAKFLDTPVKRYSSGMHVRLAFAVAAHLDPEILLIDEVLAVGDEEFQKKCLGKMDDVAKAGRTILFVSHNMKAIELLCTRALLLSAGTIAHDGPPTETVDCYFRSVSPQQGQAASKSVDLSTIPRDRVIFQHVALLDQQGNVTDHVPLGGQLRLQIALAACRFHKRSVVGIGIDDAHGRRLFGVNSAASGIFSDTTEKSCRVECTIPMFPLAPGEYWVKLVLKSSGREIDGLERAMRFRVINAGTFHEQYGLHAGVCVAPSTWSVNFDEA